MEIFEEYELINLSPDACSVSKRRYIINVGDKLYLDLDMTALYVNSISGRIAVQAEVPAPYITAIMLIWGDAPTVEEPIDGENI